MNQLHSAVFGVARSTAKSLVEVGEFLLCLLTRRSAVTFTIPPIDITDHLSIPYYSLRTGHRYSVAQMSFKPQVAPMILELHYARHTLLRREVGLTTGDLAQAPLSVQTSGKRMGQFFRHADLTLSKNMTLANS